MDIQIKEAKSGKQTLLIDSVFYHSAYDPEKESERFISTINFESSPSVIFIIEAGLGYVVPILKKKYPQAIIVNISLFQTSYCHNADAQIEFSKLKDFLIKINSSDIINSQIICWPVAQKLFPSQIESVITEYKKNFNLAKTVLITKQFFEPKWFRNSINFLKGISRIGNISYLKENILVVASGPSLKQLIPVIKENQKKFLIFALSSAINPLLKNNIIPDLCFSTDGGYWATKHLSPLIKNYLPLALAIEGAVQKQLLENLCIIPLVYDQGLAQKLYRTTQLPFFSSPACPTVSETAIKIAKSITSKKVFITGLDLSCRAGFAHVQPNIIELENSTRDSKINSSMKRIVRSEINSKTSLNTYETSFNLDNYSNCYRIIDNEISTHIKTMTEISVNEFMEEVKTFTEIPDITKKTFITEQIINPNKKKNFTTLIKKFIQNENESENWKNELFALDYAVINHLNNEEKVLKSKEIDKKNNDFLLTIRKLINE